MCIAISLVRISKTHQCYRYCHNQSNPLRKTGGARVEGRKDDESGKPSESAADDNDRGEAKYAFHDKLTWPVRFALGSESNNTSVSCQAFCHFDVVDRKVNCAIY